MDIEIRTVTENECSKLTELGRSTFLASFGEFNDPTDMETYLSSNFSQEQIVTELSNPNSEFYFAEYQEEVIGYLKVNLGDAQTEVVDGALEIERIYLTPDFQGKGIGQLLMNKAIEIGKSKNLRTIWLGVWDQNKEAVRFYERNGFKTFGTHRFMLGNDEQTDILMKMEL